MDILANEFLPSQSAPSEQWDSQLDSLAMSSVQVLSFPAIITTIIIITRKMPPRFPTIDDLLALLRVFLAHKGSGLSGGTATEAEIAFAEKDSPVKGEDVPPGPWPTSPSAAAAPPPPPPRASKRRRLLRRLISSSPS
ncbi:hypothetical protein NW762_011830 [Fusarium torreyae]|uniref:Uncharacterized protein n=1 Tax=Fusarium torreyae TaxID=1237075 RepID=A0A9W8RSB9_9HYPO|nr:hypothetical protein NW762_011830 [Fusarium torreyae]